MSFDNYGPSDSQPTDLGDGQFLRFATRGGGVALPPGVLRYAENIRLGQKTVRTRKGTKALSTDLELGHPPVILDCPLGFETAVFEINRSGSAAEVETLIPHGLADGDLVTIAGADQPEYNGTFAVTVVDPGNFTYTVSGSPATPATGTITATAGPLIYEDYEEVVRGSAVVTSDLNADAFVLALSNRAYLCRAGTASVVIDYPAGEICADLVAFAQFEGLLYLVRGGPGAALALSGAITQTAGTATVNTATPHGLATGDWVYVEGGDQNEYRGNVQITRIDADTFTYAVNAGAVSPATGDFTLRPGPPPLSWDRDPAHDFIVSSSGPNAVGLATIKMPPCDWLEEFNRRLWLPYRRDQVLGTDYSDANTIDTDVGEARIRPGGNDWLVGVLGFNDTRLFVAYRKSLHLLGLTITDLTIASGNQVQAKFGCAARRTIMDCAGQILFLTDGGVARLIVTDQLNLIADQIPLSDDIQNLFERVNWAAAGGACAQFYDNRYYLAVPLDDSPVNNALLVYSFLNGAGWESVDTFPGAFDIQALHLADYQGRVRLHAVTTFGALYLLEELAVDEFGANDVITSNVIVGKAYTRYINGASLDVKRWLRALVDLNLEPGDALRIDVAVRNPDQFSTLLTASATANDIDVTLRPRIGRRGVACSLELTSTGGRPELKGYLLESSLSDQGSKPR